MVVVMGMSDVQGWPAVLVPPSVTMIDCDLRLGVCRARPQKFDAEAGNLNPQPVQGPVPTNVQPDNGRWAKPSSWRIRHW